MGMTSRRVKRGKRSKKYLHHGCRKTSRRRYTRIQRIQRGGEMHEVCKSTGFMGFKSGITITYDDKTQMYTIGSKPYAQLSNNYGKLKKMFPQGLPTNGAGYINLNQSQFDQFAKLYCKESTDKQCVFITGFHPPIAASPAPASDGIKLIRTTDDGGRTGLNVQFFEKQHTLLVDKPLEIDVPPNPNSRQNPITKLIFTVDGDNIINVDFVLKKDVCSYCAMARYHEPSFMYIDDLNFEIPYIRKPILFGDQLKTKIISKNEVSITDQIIPIMDMIQRYANECATQPDTMELGRGYYERADHIPDKVREYILKLFRPSFFMMSTLSKSKG
jgi:hypothetical protein